jgi:hypothetical protein
MAGHERNQPTPPMNQNNTLNLKVTNMAGDPDVGADKYLAVKYACRGRATNAAGCSYPRHTVLD